MNKVQPPMLPAARRKRIGLLWLGGILGFLLLIALAWTGYLLYLSGKEGSLRVECRQRQEPLIMANLDSIYTEVEDEDNAAAALIELWSQDEPGFKERFFRGNNMPKVLPNELPWELGEMSDWFDVEGVSDEKWAILSDYLTPLEHRRPKLVAAVNRPSSRFPIILQDSYNMLMPHAVMIRQEGSRLAFDTIRAIHSNQVDRAVSNIEIMSSLARHLAQEPLTISQLVSCAIYAQTMKVSALLLSHHRLSSEQLRKLGSVCAWYSAPRALSFSVQGERASMLSRYTMDASEIGQMFDFDARETSGYKITIWAAKIFGVKQADCINILESFRAADDLIHDLKPADIPKWDTIFRKESWSFPPHLYSSRMMPPLGGLIYRHLDAETGQRSLHAALAVELFRETNGKLPASLSEVQSFKAPVPLNDLYSTDLLRIKLLENGYIIYSIGRDGIDDDAQAYGSKGKRYPEGDIVFEVSR